MPLKRCVKDVLRYHFGSVALVALFLPIGRLIKAIFGFINSALS